MIDDELAARLDRIEHALTKRKEMPRYITMEMVAAAMASEKEAHSKGLGISWQDMWTAMYEAAP